jgi:hypothetical protein
MGSGSNRAGRATGGSGAFYDGYAYISYMRDGKIPLTIICGKGGRSCGGARGEYPGLSTNGTASEIYSGNTNLVLSIDGGTRGFMNGAWDRGVAGKGGLLGKIPVSERQMISHKVGNNGQVGTGAGDTYGAQSVYAGHTYGASGNTSSGWSGGSVSSSKHGYIRVKYICNETYEFKNPGTYTLVLPVKTVFKLTMCGAGGGAGAGSSLHSSSKPIGGGQGGKITASQITLSAGEYTIIIGNGGHGGGDVALINGLSGLDSGETLIKKGSDVLFRINGARGGYGTGSFEGAVNKTGAGGKAYVMNRHLVEPVSELFDSNGDDRTSTSPISNDYGKGGETDSKGNGGSGTCGYVKLEWVRVI